MSCGAREWNAVYTSRRAVVDFIEALGTWVKESILKQLKKASVYRVTADEHWYHSSGEIVSFLSLGGR